MHQKITGQIDSTYIAQSHSLKTLQDWHMKNSHVSKLILSSQFIFPVFASIFLALYLIYLIESEPANLGKKLNSQADGKSPNEIRDAANAKIWIIVTISTLFTCIVIATDITALLEYRYLPKEIAHYIGDKSNPAFIHLHIVPISMLFYDLLSLIFFIFVPFIIVCCKCCCMRCGEFKISDFLYTLLSPLTCIATHSYHIIFAFINNPYHATSVLLFYIMTLFIVVVIFQKTYYFVLFCFEKQQKCGHIEGCVDKQSGQRRKGYDIVQKCVLVLSFIVVIIGLAACIGLTVAVLIILPLNNAIDLASNEIYAIYQASVTVFAALVTFQVFFGQTNSIFAVFIKAADKRVSKTTNGDKTKWKTEWKEMSEKEKEIRLGDLFLSYVNFDAMGNQTTGVSEESTPSAEVDGHKTEEGEGPMPADSGRAGAGDQISSVPQSAEGASGQTSPDSDQPVKGASGQTGGGVHENDQTTAKVNQKIGKGKETDLPRLEALKETGGKSKQAKRSSSQSEGNSQ